MPLAVRFCHCWCSPQSIKEPMKKKKHTALVVSYDQRDQGYTVDKFFCIWWYANEKITHTLSFLDDGELVLPDIAFKVRKLGSE